jgi:hypothetical protein
VPIILLPFRPMYHPGLDARPVIDRVEPLQPIYAADVRLEGDTIVIVEGERDVQRWGRDRHWCAFPGSCPTCASPLTATDPVQFRRAQPLNAELLVVCRNCGDRWVAASRTTLPI